MEGSQEFYSSLAILGGIIAMGLLITIGLALVGIAVYKKKKETNLKIYGKERSNGHSKTITRKKW